MNLDNIEINTQSSIKLKLGKTLYFDPFKIEESTHDADIIFITHEHYDHFDPESISKIKNDNTIVVGPKSMEDIIGNIEFKDYIYLNPNEEINIAGINIKTIPAYNNEKSFHPRESNWLGYIISYNSILYYIAGDTDKTKENETVKCDIPIHYGSIVGDKEFGRELKDNLINSDIEVVEKLF